MAADYSKQIKQNLLITEGTADKESSCLSFLAGLLKGSRYRSYVKLDKMSASAVIAALTGCKETDTAIINFGRHKITMEFKYSGGKLLVNGLDMLKIRGKFVKFLSVIEKKNIVRYLRQRKCMKAFFQGMFISCGYVQNPEEAFHLEFRISNKWVKAAFSRCAKEFKVKFSYFQKGKFTSYYLKSGKKIAVFLNKIGLFDAADEISSLIEAKKVVAEINRRVNSETANIAKTVSAAESQIEKINTLLAFPDQSFWKPKLLETARIRVRFPLDSLAKLGQRFNPPIGKSAVNHRMREINKIYEDLALK